MHHTRIMGFCNGIAVTDLDSAPDTLRSPESDVYELEPVTIRNPSPFPIARPSFDHWPESYSWIQDGCA